MIEEFVTFENGARLCVPRESSPKDTASGPVKPELLVPSSYLANYQVGRDGPPPVMYRTPDDSVVIEISNLNYPQMVPGKPDREFWHRSMTHGELHFSHVGARTVETENGTVTQQPGEFIYFPRGLSHRNVGHGPENVTIVIYLRQDLLRVDPPRTNGR